MKNIKKLIALAAISISLCTSISVQAMDIPVKRLGGKDRIQTSEVICNNFQGAKNIILAYSENYPDALSSAILSKKYKAPILLTNEGKYNETVEYIKRRIPKTGTVFIMGGTGVMKPILESKIKDAGYKVKRLGGKNRFKTNMLINNEARVQRGNSVFICCSDNFADALSVSSISGYRQFPTILCSKSGLDSDAVNYIKNLQPQEAYILGTPSVISSNVEKQIQSVTPRTKAKRLGGKDRYDTSFKVLQAFSDATNTLSVASGKNYPDALSGSALASNLDSNILLVNDTLSKAQLDLIKEIEFSSVYVFGASGAVNTNLEKQIKDTVNSDEDFKVIDIR